MTSLGCVCGLAFLLAAKPNLQVLQIYLSTVFKGQRGGVFQDCIFKPLLPTHSYRFVEKNPLEARTTPKKRQSRGGISQTLNQPQHVEDDGVREQYKSNTKKINNQDKTASR